MTRKRYRNCLTILMCFCQLIKVDNGAIQNNWQSDFTFESTNRSSMLSASTYGIYRSNQTLQIPRRSKYYYGYNQSTKNNPHHNAEMTGANMKSDESYDLTGGKIHKANQGEAKEQTTILPQNYPASLIDEGYLSESVESQNRRIIAVNHHSRAPSYAKHTTYAGVRGDDTVRSTHTSLATDGDINGISAAHVNVTFGEILLPLKRTLDKVGQLPDIVKLITTLGGTSGSDSVNGTMASYFANETSKLNQGRNSKYDRKDLLPPMLPLASAHTPKTVFSQYSLSSARRHKPKKIFKKFLLPLLIAYKLKFLTLIPLLVGGLVLLVGATGLAGFFFALFTAVMSLKSPSGGKALDGKSTLNVK